MMVTDKLLEFRRVPDGVICENLCPGFWLIEAPVLPYLIAMSRSGGFWPYEVRSVFADLPNGLCSVLIAEGE